MTTPASIVPGPDGQPDTGILFDGVGAIEYSPSAQTALVLAGGSIFIWATGAVTMKIGDTAISLTEHANNGTWHLYYANDITASGALAITATGGVAIGADLRAYAVNLSADARQYYYNDVINNGGNIVLP